MTIVMSKNILLVDDDDSIRWVLNELLSDLGHKVTQLESAENALEQLEYQMFDLLISDVRMSGKSGMELLQNCQQKYPDMPVIIMTAHSDLESAVQAYQKGAFEYLPKPFDLDEVVATVERALTPSKIVENISQKTSSPNTFSIIGDSPAMQDLYRAIGRLSTSQVTVLIHGESGTGKELVASALHQHSPRKDQPFIALNMAAIPKDLIESELFGHEKGAFTGANTRYLGRFEQANNGTLFLDEIGDMPLETQTRLLRVLSEGAFYRIGSSQPTQVSVRIIAATHQNLRDKVEQGEFREDLYHRLNVIPLHLPPLRLRTGDIPLLSEFFLANISKEITEPKKIISSEALEVMQNYQWPGNVRQLENVCRWLTVMSNGQHIMSHDLPPDVLSLSNQITPEQHWKNTLSQNLIKDFQKGNKNAFTQAQEKIEQLMIKTALEVSLGKKAEASKILGWGRNTLTRKLKN
jgi:two-component system, NtrC family, nitrogen regulation response regulator GlnG